MGWFVESDEHEKELRDKGFVCFWNDPHWNGRRMASEYHGTGIFHHGTTVELGADAGYRCCFCGEEMRR